MFSSRLYEVIEHVSSRCHPNQDLDASPAPALAVWPPVTYVTIVVFGSLILKIKTTAAHLTHLSCRWNGCAWRWGSSSLHHRSQFWNWSDHTGPLWKGGHTAEVSTTCQAWVVCLQWQRAWKGQFIWSRPSSSCTRQLGRHCPGLGRVTAPAGPGLQVQRACSRNKNGKYAANRTGSRGKRGKYRIAHPLWHKIPDTSRLLTEQRKGQTYCLTVFTTSG